MTDEAALTNMIIHRSETAVAEPAAPTETPKEKPKPEEKDDIDDIEKRARKPPADGPCKGCGENKPLNRLMLCYPCWIKKQNTEKGWREGQPHPVGCGCDLDCRFDKQGVDN